MSYNYILVVPLHHNNLKHKHVSIFYSLHIRGKRQAKLKCILQNWFVVVMELKQRQLLRQKRKRILQSGNKPQFVGISAFWQCWLRRHSTAISVVAEKAPHPYRDSPPFEGDDGHRCA